MRVSIVMFALGVWLCQYLPTLPPPGWVGALSLVSTVVAAGAFLLRGTRGARVTVWLVAMATGFAWAAWRAEARLADALPMAWEGRDVAVIGVVSDLPQDLESGSRFVLDVEQAEGPVPRRILLSWASWRGEGAAPPAVRPGERWAVTVRLKRPHGFANPHGFDYEAWLLERGLRATGYVRADPAPRLLASMVDAPMLHVHRLRDDIRTRFAAALPDAPYAGVLIALAVGDQRAIPKAQWTVFRRTGVAHLVSISGLHVSLAALLAAGAVGWLWRRVPALLLRYPARKAAALGGLACATAYALLAGLGIPTQRALVMLGVVVFALLRGREVAGSRVMSLALLAVLLADPWAVLAPGFWLSFGAVGVILFVLGGRAGRLSGWRAAVAIQAAITLATIPALLVLFSGFSLVGPLANALAIPLVSFVVTPLALAAIVVPVDALLALAHGITASMMGALEWLAALPLAMWQHGVPPAALFIAATAGVAWLLLPRGTPSRFAAVLAVVPMLAWVPQRPSAGDFEAIVMDVGHGLAVHIRTASHDLLYDAGPAYGTDSDAGERVLLPYLTAIGVERLDRLLLSHDDIDHSGGAAALLAGLPIDVVMAGFGVEGATTAGSVLACAAGARWQWDEVEFEVLYPDADDAPFRRDNDASCVLRVAGRGGSLLLAGDVEASAERLLLSRHGPRLASSVVVVPHHGSRSSSSPALVEAIGAQAAIFSVANLNRFHHPHPSVWARWVQAGARNWRTDSQGAIRISATRAGVELSAQRPAAPRYWHGR